MNRPPKNRADEVRDEIRSRYRRKPNSTPNVADNSGGLNAPVPWRESVSQKTDRQEDERDYRWRALAVICIPRSYVRMRDISAPAAKLRRELRWSEPDGLDSIVNALDVVGGEIHGPADDPLLRAKHRERALAIFDVQGMASIERSFTWRPDSVLALLAATRMSEVWTCCVRLVECALADDPQRFAGVSGTSPLRVSKRMAEELVRWLGIVPTDWHALACDMESMFAEAWCRGVSDGGDPEGPLRVMMRGLNAIHPEIVGVRDSLAKPLPPVLRGGFYGIPGIRAWCEAHMRSDELTPYLKAIAASCDDEAGEDPSMATRVGFMPTSLPTAGPSTTVAVVSAGTPTAPAWFSHAETPGGILNPEAVDHVKQILACMNPEIRDSVSADDVIKLLNAQKQAAAKKFDEYDPSTFVSPAFSASSQSFPAPAQPPKDPMEQTARTSPTPATDPAIAERDREAVRARSAQAMRMITETAAMLASKGTSMEFPEIVAAAAASLGACAVSSDVDVDRALIQDAVYASALVSEDPSRCDAELSNLRGRGASKDVESAAMWLLRMAGASTAPIMYAALGNFALVLSRLAGSSDHTLALVRTLTHGTAMIAAMRDEAAPEAPPPAVAKHPRGRRASTFAQAVDAATVRVIARQSVRLAGAPVEAAAVRCGASPADAARITRSPVGRALLGGLASFAVVTLAPDEGPAQERAAAVAVELGTAALTEAGGALFDAITAPLADALRGLADDDDDAPAPAPALAAGAPLAADLGAPPEREPVPVRTKRSS